MAPPPNTASLLANIPASVLHDAALRAATADTRRSPWRHLTPQAVDEGLTILDQLGPPGFGFWHRHTARHPTTIPAPPHPPYRPGHTHLPWEPWELLAAAVHYSLLPPTSSLTIDDKRELLAELAYDHHLTARHLADAYHELDVT